jgi:hypothetical protein
MNNEVGRRREEQSGNCEMHLSSEEDNAATAASAPARISISPPLLAMVLLLAIFFVAAISEIYIEEGTDGKDLVTIVEKTAIFRNTNHSDSGFAKNRTDDEAFNISTAVWLDLISSSSYRQHAGIAEINVEKDTISNTNHSPNSTIVKGGKPEVLKISTAAWTAENAGSLNQQNIAEVTSSNASTVARIETAVLIEELINGTRNMSTVDIAEALPDVDISNTEIFSVYSEKSLSQLSKLKAKIQRGESITLVINGGSSSAGAPRIPYEERYFVRLATRIETGFGANITVIDRSHGARNTIHSAHLVPSFLPQTCDILIWEFAINDGNKDADVRNAMLMWLRNVEAHLNPQPLVLLVYLWKSPFQATSKGKILSRTFDQHKSLAAEYDFVLGHFKMGAYMDALGWDFRTLKSAFLADNHHPKAVVHHVIGKGLYQLLASNQTNISVNNTIGSQKRTELEWICGTGTPAKREVFQVFNDTKGIARGSYTADMPRNADNLSRPGMLIPSGPLQMENFGKAVSDRPDRQRGIILPCCNASTGIVEFDVSTLGRIQAFMLTNRCVLERRLDVRLFADGKLMTNITLIQPSDWKCLLGGYNMNIGDLKSLDVDLVVVSREMKKIGLCDARCDKKSTLPLVSVSVF